ncbi:ERBB2 [Bugula neritina]|uniref:ERBB2 n=1 Tax=Bugula neritina TaxID=10212 RepID=A0A7J7JI96_BUGNE|nr:ERBB2 [Bugula neritina]
MFRNLKIVDGKGSSDGFGISIISDHIKSFDLNSLPKLSVGGVNIMAPELCYATSDLLEDIFKSADTVTTSIPESAAETCALEGNVCHAECNSTCIGPASSQCFACSPETGDCSLECKNFEFEGECVETCSMTDHYINGTSCMNCHEECGGGCTGPLNTDCFFCKNYKNGNRCLPKCPNPTYANENKTCQPCNNFCSFDKELSCSGPEPFITSDGCDSCALIEIEDKKKIFPKCLNSSNSCPPGFLSYSQKLIIADFVNESVDLAAVDQACMKCEVQCAACIGKPRYCTKCSSIAYSVTKQNGADGDCTLICDPTKYFIDETSRNCHECSDQCRGGCTGKTDKDCISCSVNKLVLNATENLFQCVTICPPTHNYTIYDKDGPKCVNYKSYMASKLGANKTAPPLPVRVDIIIGSVFAALVVFAVTAVIMAYYCRQKKKHIEKAKELELQLFGTGNAEPVMPTDAEPDLARLRLVKESELKRGDIIGSGAFGTVFKGYLIPDNENVKVPVAIKVLIEGTSPSQNTELLDEARVMASVEHPCCIKIVAVCMTAQMMLITPLMPEGCLLSYVKAHAGQLGSKIIMNWCAQISKGMEHLQRCGIVHRDLAARNVLVHSEHQVKLLTSDWPSC